MSTNSKIFLLTQPNYPVPAIRDGAAAIVIQDTMECLDYETIQCISVWDKGLQSLNYNPEKYLFYNKNLLWWRLIRKMILFIPFYNSCLKGLNSKEQGILVALKWFEWLKKPGIVVVHTSKADWALRVKNFCDTKTKVIGYYHNSEVHLSHPATLVNMGKHLNGHIFVSDFAREMFINKISQLMETKQLNVFTVKNGANPSRFENKPGNSLIRQRLNIGPEKVVLLFVGRLIPRKGLHCLLKALTEVSNDVLQNLVLIIAGSLDYYNEAQTEYISGLHNLATNRHLIGKVHFVGYVPHTEIHSYYHASDIFIFPSIENEGMGLSLIEAEMSSLPSIVSAVGGAMEAFVPNMTGLLIEPVGDSRIISQKIEILAKNPGLRKDMGFQARRFALENFSRERMAQNFWNIVKKNQD